METDAHKKAESPKSSRIRRSEAFDPERLRQVFEESEFFNKSFSKETLMKFIEFGSILAEANTKINLTTIIEAEEMAYLHFQDSLMLIPEIKKLGFTNPKIADIGSGAGFPGIPLSIAQKNWTIVLMDSLLKRVKFQKQVKAALSLPNLSCLHIRAEEAGRNKNYRERFDVVTCRAVGKLPTLLEYAIPLCKENGYFIAMKSSAENEILESEKAAAILSAKLIELSEFKIYKNGQSRSLIVYRKMKETPEIYPRAQAQIARKAL